MLENDVDDEHRTGRRIVKSKYIHFIFRMLCLNRFTFVFRCHLCMPSVNVVVTHHPTEFQMYWFVQVNFEW